MRIKYEKNVATLKSQGVIMMEKIQSEENRSKDILDKKLQLEQDLLMLKEDLSKATETHANNREELIKLEVKNSQLTSQNAIMSEDEVQLKEENSKIIEENESLEAENSKLKKQIAETIQRIDINNLLKEIDIEEMQLLAKNNKQMNFSMENLITKWNFIMTKNDDMLK